MTKQSFTGAAFALAVLKLVGGVAHGKPLQLAAGLGMTQTARHDYGEQTYFRTGFEIPAYAYIPLADPIYGRGGVRLGYSNFQPQMPKGLQVRETDLSFGVDAGLVYDWYLVPSLSIGYGVIFRQIKLATSEKIPASGEEISNSERLDLYSAQAGLGFPFFHGFMLLDVFTRYHSITEDDRSNWMFGLETTLQVL